jgi:hypothetical protein
MQMAMHSKEDLINKIKKEGQNGVNGVSKDN